MQYLIIATAYVSIYTLVFMSLDRFLAVVYPIESMTLRTESNCRKAIIATWDERRTEAEAEGRTRCQNQTILSSLASYELELENVLPSCAIAMKNRSTFLVHGEPEDLGPGLG